MAEFDTDLNSLAVTICEPDYDHIIDGMLTERDSAGKPDPLDPGLFPSLGFTNEKRGSYFMQVEQGDIMVSVWRIIGPPTSYSLHTYRKHTHEGIVSWGGSVESRIVAEDLVQVQAIIHHILTFGGNPHDQEAQRMPTRRKAGEGMG